jgi:hypothetical protein
MVNLKPNSRGQHNTEMHSFIFPSRGGSSRYVDLEVLYEV